MSDKEHNKQPLVLEGFAQWNVSGLIPEGNIELFYSISLNGLSTTRRLYFCLKYGNKFNPAA